MQETWVPSLGGEDPQEEEMATHSSIPASRIPWTEDPGPLQSVKLQKSLTQLKQPNNKKKEKSQAALSSLKCSIKTFSFLQKFMLNKMKIFLIIKLSNNGIICFSKE